MYNHQVRNSRNKIHDQLLKQVLLVILIYLRSREKSFQQSEGPPPRDIPQMASDISVSVLCRLSHSSASFLVDILLCHSGSTALGCWGDTVIPAEGKMKFDQHFLLRLLVSVTFFFAFLYPSSLWQFELWLVHNCWVVSSQVDTGLSGSVGQDHLCWKAVWETWSLKENTGSTACSEVCFAKSDRWWFGWAQRCLNIPRMCVKYWSFLASQFSNNDILSIWIYGASQILDMF